MQAEMKLSAGHAHLSNRNWAIRPAILWGPVFGVIQAASPIALCWLPTATAYALSLSLIASISGQSVANQVAGPFMRLEGLCQNHSFMELCCLPS